MQAYVVYKKSDGSPMSFLLASFGAEEIAKHCDEMPEYAVSNNTVDVDTSDPQILESIVVQGGVASVGAGV